MGLFGGDTHLGYGRAKKHVVPPVMVDVIGRIIIIKYHFSHRDNT